MASCSGHSDNFILLYQHEYSFGIIDLLGRGGQPSLSQHHLELSPGVARKAAFRIGKRVRHISDNDLNLMYGSHCY